MIGLLKRFVGLRTGSRLTDGMHRIGLVMAALPMLVAIIGSTIASFAALNAKLGEQPSANALRQKISLCRPASTEAKPWEIYQFCTDEGVRKLFESNRYGEAIDMAAYSLGALILALMIYGACRLLAWIINGFRGR